MKRERRLSGTIRAVVAHWPAYTLVYSGIVLALIIIGVSAERGLIGLIPLSLAALIVLIYFLLTTLWRAHLKFDPDGLVPHQVLFDLGQIKTNDTFVMIDLGLRHQAIDLARRLTTGKVIVVDVYNPQWTTSHALVRLRSKMPSPPTDPRILWRDGRSNLLPLPDKSVKAVILCQVLSEFWQEGDRLQLLQEIYRVLSENGRLLLAEQTRSRTNWILMGPGTLTLKPVEKWRDLLGKAGFHIRNEKNLQGVLHCFRADKPTHIQAQQLTLGLDL